VDVLQAVGNSPLTLGRQVRRSDCPYSACQRPRNKPIQKMTPFSPAGNGCTVRLPLTAAEPHRSLFVLDACPPPKNDVGTLRETGLLHQAGDCDPFKGCAKDNFGSGSLTLDYPPC
jgi:hypothetical protein